MFDVAIFCKSFDEDFPRLKLLLDSYNHHCNEIPFILSVPRSQVATLKQSFELSANVEVICDEDYCRPEDAGSYGWVQQQLCKLAIHRTGLAKAYFCIDSDSYLLNGINALDLYDGNRMRIVYSKLLTKYAPDNQPLLRFLLDSTAEPPPTASPGTLDGFDERLVEIRRRGSGNDNPINRGYWINQLFQIPDATYAQPGQMFHAPLLARMEEFFKQRGLSLGDLIKLVPWEFNWYSGWSAAAASDETTFSISPVVHFASDQDVDHAKAAGVTSEHLRQRFKVVQMAARHFDTNFF